LSAVQEADHIMIWKKDVPEPSTLPCGLGIIHALRFSPDDTMLAVGCEQGFILLSPETQQRLFWARGEVVRSVAIHPDGHLLATVSQAGRVEVWSLHSQRQVAEFNGEESGDWGQVSFSTDGSYLVLKQRGVSRGWKINGTPEFVEFSGHRGGIPGIAFSPNGLLLASVSKDSQIKLWDTVTGSLHSTLAEQEEYTAEVQAVDFSPDGKLLATGDWSSEIRVWDVAKTKLACKAFCLPLGKIWQLRFDPRNRFLLAAGWFGTQGWEIRHDDSGVTLAPFHWRYAGEVRDFAWLPTGEGYAAISEAGGGGTLWHYSLGKPDTALASGTPYRQFSLQVCHDGRLLYPVHGRFNAWDVTRGRPAPDPQLNFKECYASPDGRFLATREHGAVNNPTQILDSSTGNEQGRLPGSSSAIWCMAWSPDGTKLAHGYADGRLVMWRLEEVRERLAELGLDMPSTATQSVPPQLGVDAAHWAALLAEERTRLYSPAMSACMHNLDSV
jgi:WD40 repeat protein